nr:MAG TPA: hypothetical protein [Bacteriophage sp.]DAV98341.1 MAG TPA: hypothetical protein [Caudoviricetes sp.]DAY72264.1 MAG TPA: hypothetical protein [Caudoviricetes sp.]
MVYKLYFIKLIRCSLAGVWIPRNCPPQRTSIITILF